MTKIQELRQKLAELEKKDDVFLTVTDIAPIMQKDPNNLRREIQEDTSLRGECHRFGFLVYAVMTRIDIPKIPFIRWAKANLFGEAVDDISA